MDERAIRKTIRLRFRRLKKYYGRMENAFDPEAIHHFRVELKKLRAFLRMLSAANNNHEIKIPHSLKNIYQQAGSVRDLQLHIGNIGNSGKSPLTPVNHLRQLRRKLTIAKRELKKVMRPGVLPDARKKIEKKVSGGQEDAVVQNFVRTKMIAISKIISRKTTGDTDLHTVRKYLKDIIYIARIFETELGQGFPIRNWDKEKEKYLTGLADDLGKFQDSCISLAQLREDLLTNAPDNEKALIRGLSREQQQVKRKLKQALKEKCADPNHFLL